MPSEHEYNLECEIIDESLKSDINGSKLSEEEKNE